MKDSSYIRGSVIYVLIIVVLVQSLYPITESGTITAQLIYQLIYSSLIIVGILVARDNPRYQKGLIALGIVWVGTSFVYAYGLQNGADLIPLLLTAYVAIALFQSMVTFLLLRFIFTTPKVTTDVLYAASAVYFLLGAIFVPIYGLIETVTFATGNGIHAFSDNVTAVGEIFPWQTFVYYSYATLTTLGYGDILPVTMWARSAASLQAIIGVLYITVIMARLVGLYAAEKQLSD